MPHAVTFRTTNRAYRAAARLSANVRRVPLQVIPGGRTFVPRSIAAFFPSGTRLPLAYVSTQYRAVMPRSVIGVGAAVAVGTVGYLAWQWVRGPNSDVPTVRENLTEGQIVGDWRVDRLFTPGGTHTQKTPLEAWDVYIQQSQPLLDAVPGSLLNSNHANQASYDARKSVETASPFLLDPADNVSFGQVGYDSGGAFPHNIVSEVRYESNNISNPQEVPATFPVLVPGVAPLSVPQPGPLPGTWALPTPLPYSIPETVPSTEPAVRSLTEPVPSRPAVLTAVEVVVWPNGRTSQVRQPKDRKIPPRKMRETKFGAKAQVANVLIRVARELGNGIEWIEVFSDGWGYSARTSIWGQRRAGRHDTVNDRVRFLQQDGLTWSWGDFLQSLAQKVSEDIVAGVFFAALTRALGRLGQNVPYKLTGLTSGAF